MGSGSSKLEGTLPTISPSDLAAANEGEVTVGGRVVRVDGARCTLADAIAHVTFELQPGSLDEGDLAEVRALLREGELSEVSVVWRERPMSSSSEDARRFSFGGVAKHLHERGRILRAIRALFDGLDFLEVETPILVPSPGLDVHLDAIAADDAFLITSPEYQMKRLIAAGIPRCFQLARCFRRGELGALHNPEFTMLEWYRSFVDVGAVMDDTERVVLCAVETARSSATIELNGREIALARPFARISVRDAFAIHAGLDEASMLHLADHDEEQFYRLMIDRVEPALATLPHPIFLMRYPASQASLARRCPDDPRYAERFELYVGGVELCNGFGELTDPIEQRMRLERDQRTRMDRGLPVYPIDERFLAALEGGMPRCAGNALGIDRLVALATSARTIGDVQTFPAGVL